MKPSLGLRRYALPLLIATCLLGACGSVDDGPPKIDSFTAEVPILSKGGKTTLLAEFEGGEATVDNGVGIIQSGVPVEVSPTADVVYTLTVHDDGETDATATAAIGLFDNTILVITSTGQGLGSLPAALGAANDALGTTGIAFAVPLPATIELPVTLISSGKATIVGPGVETLTISGGEQRRILVVRGGELTLRGVTLSRGVGAGGKGGNGPSGGGGGGGAGMGGAIFINSGAVILEKAAVSDNLAQGGAGGTSPGNGLANGGGGGGFGGNGNDGSSTALAMGGVGGSGGALGGSGGAAGSAAIGDGAGGGGAGAGEQQNGGAGSFGGGGGGRGGFAGAGAGGFGGGAGGGTNPVAGTFGGLSAGNQGGGGAGLGGAIFLRAGTLKVTDTVFRNNRALAGASGGSTAEAGKAKAGAIFALPTTGVTLTNVTYEGSAALDAGATATDNLDVYLTQP